LALRRQVNLQILSVKKSCGNGYGRFLSVKDDFCKISLLRRGYQVYLAFLVSYILVILGLVGASFLEGDSFSVLSSIQVMQRNSVASICATLSRPICYIVMYSICEVRMR
jgi:hypothetical protein